MRLQKTVGLHRHVTRQESAPAVAQQHLRSILAFCNSPLMNSIEAYIQFEPGLISGDGHVTNPSTEEFLRQFVTEFQGFITRVYTVLPRTT